MKILTIVGARPQFIKAATISRIIREKPSICEIIVHTGQHYDSNMSEIFFQELDIPEPHYNLEVGSGTHAFQTGKMLTGIEEVMMKEKPDWTMVYGDTNSTLAGALASAKLHIPVAHVEAGLRSFNRQMPEEINRIVADHIGDLLFAPTLTAIENLKKEGLEEKTYFTGDVMYDSVIYYKHRILENPAKYLTPDIPERFYLATIHRAENTDNPSRLAGILQAFGKLPLPVLIPLHPRTAKTLTSDYKIPSNLIIIQPVGYLEMLCLVIHSEKVLTDSGGLQKEAYFLSKPCITLRNETEWLETLHDDWNQITGTDPEKIILAANKPHPPNPQKNSFGQGNAALLTVNKLINPGC